MLLPLQTQDSLKIQKVFSKQSNRYNQCSNGSDKNNSNLIFASSAAVYPLNVKKISENYEFYPSNAYGLSKN